MKNVIVLLRLLLLLTHRNVDVSFSGTFGQLFSVVTKRFKSETKKIGTDTRVKSFYVHRCTHHHTVSMEGIRWYICNTFDDCHCGLLSYNGYNWYYIWCRWCFRIKQYFFLAVFVCTRVTFSHNQPNWICYARTSWTWTIDGFESLFPQRMCTLNDALVNYWCCSFQLKG